MPCSHSNLKAAFMPIAALALVAGAPAIARPAPAATSAAPATNASPILGEWELDRTRMPDGIGAGPARVTFTFADAGAGQWRTTVAITAPDGSVRRVTSTYRRDGKAVQAEGDTTDADSAAFSSPAPNVLVMSLAKDKHPTSVRVYTISSDGKGMTESAAAVDDDGAPYVRTFHFKRIR